MYIAANTLTVVRASNVNVLDRKWTNLLVNDFKRRKISSFQNIRILNKNSIEISHFWMKKKTFSFKVAGLKCNWSEIFAIECHLISHLAFE